SLAAAGWNLAWLDTGAIWAPRTWVDPNDDASAMDWMPTGALLCRRGEDVVLVDTGLGVLRDGFPYDARQVDLAGALDSAGAQEDDVTVVVLTHLDSDHAGGTPGFRGNGLLQARVVVLDRTFDAAGEESDLKDWLATATTVETVADGGEVVPGMRLRSA